MTSMTMFAPNQKLFNFAWLVKKVQAISVQLRYWLNTYKVRYILTWRKHEH